MSEVDKVLNSAADLLKGWLNKDAMENFKNSIDIRTCIENCSSPCKEDIFNAFKVGNPEEINVLILGQDPYTKRSGKAHGYAFSVGNGKQDASLLNIYKAVQDYQTPNEIFDKNKKYKTDLSKWAKDNKVLLLNTALTHAGTDKKTIDFHIEKWFPFVKEVIGCLLKRDNNNLAIFLWGVPAQKKFLQCLNEIEGIEFIAKEIKFIPKNENGKFEISKNYKVEKREEEVTIETPNRKKILIFMTNHPSPLIENRKSEGKFIAYSQKHFKTCDDFLKKCRQKKVWENLWKEVSK